MNGKPIPYELTNSNGEAVMNKKVVVVLFGLLAKRAKPIIILTTPSQSICRPKPILKG
jgi:hypothetical protein